MPLHSSRHLVDALLEQIPRLFAANQTLDGCGTAAIEAAVQVLKVGRPYNQLVRNDMQMAIPPPCFGGIAKEDALV